MPTARPHGRSLADFGNLSTAEQKLLDAASRGDLCMLTSRRPEVANTQNCVRADFIRFLVLGGDDACPVHELGVWLQGAWIDGVLQLDFCTLLASLRLWGCRLERLEAYQANFVRLDLQGTLVAAGINADAIHVAGSVFLRSGFAANGEVRFRGATIGDDIDCSDSSIINSNAVALSLDGAEVTGSVFLGPSFTATGEVRLPSAKIGGSLDCSTSTLANPGGVALGLDGADIKGSVFLREGMTAIGEVRLIGVLIGGSLDCSDASFNNAIGIALGLDRADIKGGVFLQQGFNANGEVRLFGVHISGSLSCCNGSFTNSGGIALSLDGADINGSVLLRDNFAAMGVVDFSCARIGALVDARACWPQTGQLVLDGLTVGRLTGGAPTGGNDRVKWLKFQTEAHLTGDFRSQPWEEMIRVLRAMGHDEDAKIVSIAKQDQLRAAGKIDWRQQLRRPLSTQLNDGRSARFSIVGWALHGLWGRLARYGYRPLRLVSWMICVWAIGSGLFWLGMKGGYMAPTSPIVITNGSIDEACDAGPDAGDRRWTLCSKLPDEYSTFQPMAYSLDLILPVISLQQDTEWAPVVGNANRWYWFGVGLRALMWFEILFGWMGSLLLIAIFTNLVKKD